MLKYMPFIVVGIVVVPLTAFQWNKMDWVWGENTAAMQCAYLLETRIPQEFGDWVGVDQQVDPQILDIAGADGYISRAYTNQQTNQTVVIWFIVGHFREISRHTPDFCYKAAGFQQVERDQLHRFEVDGLPVSTFRTAKFYAEPGGLPNYQRVFWGWWRPDPLDEAQSVSDVEIQWSAPEEPRVDFGFCRALYKLYLTANSTEEELPDESVCKEFASEFLPIVDQALKESGVVMVNKELPADAEQVLKRMQEKIETGEQDAGRAPGGETAEEEDEVEGE